MLSCGGDEEIPPTSWFVQIPRTSWFVEFAKQVDNKGKKKVKRISQADRELQATHS